MKSKKWIWVTLTILLTLVVLVGVAGAGFRIGLMQSASFTRNANGTAAQFPAFGHMRGFENNPNGQRGGDPHMMQGFGPGNGPGMMQGFGQRGFGRGEHSGRGGFFPPLFGLVHLILLGGLIWLGFTLVKNSGWRITRVAQPAPLVNEAPSVDEKKE